jgi:hypothetical protein
MEDLAVEMSGLSEKIRCVRWPVLLHPSIGNRPENADGVERDGTARKEEKTWMAISRGNRLLERIENFMEVVYFSSSVRVWSVGITGMSEVLKVVEL